MTRYKASNIIHGKSLVNGRESRSFSFGCDAAEAAHGLVNVLHLLGKACWRPATVDHASLNGAFLNPCTAGRAVAFGLEAFNVDPKRGSMADGAGAAFVFRKHGDRIIADHVHVPRSDAGTLEGHLMGFLRKERSTLSAVSWVLKQPMPTTVPPSSTALGT